MKKNLALVQPANATPAPALPMPKHFKARQKAAWHDLLESVSAELLVKENRWTLEIAATLMAKFRSGQAMNATETKELKKQLIALGLAKADEGDGRPAKSRNAAKYFNE